MMQVITIDTKSGILNKVESSHLEQVIILGDKNSATLGFLQREVFTKYANDGQIFVALDDKNTVLGYLLYGINRKVGLVYITHLCVDQSQRGKGIAKILFEKFKTKTQDNFKGIRVHCRRDYPINEMWAKLGFRVIQEKIGRSKSGQTRLTVWWFDHEHSTLFDFISEQQEETKLKVAIDANIFYDLQNDPIQANKESHALLDDWLDIELCLTDEIFYEISRNPSEPKRNYQMKIAHTYPKLSSPDDKFQMVNQQLQHLFPASKRKSDKSDLRQIAKTIAANISFFITRDENLLKRANEFYDLFGLHVIRPTDLIIYQDVLMRETEYHPARLAGSSIKMERIQLDKNSLLNDAFRNETGESKSEFRDKLHYYLSHPHTFEAFIIHENDTLLAFVIYDNQHENKLEVPILRIAKNDLSSTLARHLVHYIVSASYKESHQLTKITEKFISKDLVETLHEQGFVPNNNSWLKVNLAIIDNIQGITNHLKGLNSQFPEDNKYFERLINTLQKSDIVKNSQDLLKIEKFLYPAKITNIDIPCYIIPIWPIWAMNLFDPNIAKQDLFGAEPTLMLNIENVYYRASRPMIYAPGRILWYVSKRKGKYQGTKSIRACSYLNEVFVDTPKSLFSQFKRLGIYKWENIFKVAKKDADKKIMAFQFSNTELFNSPVHADKLQEIWIQERGKNFSIQSPIKISSNLFYQLYKIGIES